MLLHTPMQPSRTSCADKVPSHESKHLSGSLFMMYLRLAQASYSINCSRADRMPTFCRVLLSRMQCSNMMALVHAFLQCLIAEDCIRLQVLPGVRMTLPSLGLFTCPFLVTLTRVKTLIYEYTRSANEVNRHCNCSPG